MIIQKFYRNYRHEISLINSGLYTKSPHFIKQKRGVYMGICYFLFFFFFFFFFSLFKNIDKRLIK